MSSSSGNRHEDTDVRLPQKAKMGSWEEWATVRSVSAQWESAAPFHTHALSLLPFSSTAAAVAATVVGSARQSSAVTGIARHLWIAPLGDLRHAQWVSKYTCRNAIATLCAFLPPLKFARLVRPDDYAKY